MKNQLRIIGGDWKRRQLPFASIEGLRPTPDRVRETLFNWLMWEVQNAQVLDMCAGSGALAFEALSRGAASVVIIEPDRTQAQFLTQNLELLKVTKTRAQLKVATAQQVLPTLQTQFDLVFLDPPYSLDLWETLAAQANHLIKDNAYIYVEADRDLQSLKLPASWRLIKNTKAGMVRAGLYQKIPSQEHN